MSELEYKQPRNLGGQLRRSGNMKRAKIIKKMYYVDNMSMQEIADTLQVSVTTVHHYVHANKTRGADITDWELKK